MAMRCGLSGLGTMAFSSVVVSAALFISAAGVGIDDPLFAKATPSKSKSAAKSKKEIEKSDETDLAADDEAAAGLEADEDLSALIVPSSPVAKAKSIDRTKYSQELRGLLTDGMNESNDAAGAAKRHFDASRQLVADEPRTAYAYGVVLIAQKKMTDALEQFHSAARLTKAPFLPALQGVAWVHIVKNDYGKGLPAVLELARKIEGSKESWPTDHDRLHSAEWVGRMVGFLQGPGQQPDQAQAIEKLAADVNGTLTLERKEACERGIKWAAERHREMKEQAARPVNEVLNEAKQKRQEILDAAKLADAEVKQLEEEIRDIKRPHDKRIAELNHDKRQHAQEAKKAAREVAETEELVSALSVPQPQVQARTISRGRMRMQVPSLRPENAQEKKARETRLAAAQQSLQQAQTSLDRAKEQMTDARKQAEEEAAEYKRAAADKRPALAAAKRKSADLALRARDAEHNGLTAEKLKTRVTDLQTYVPLDPEAEKNRLLATLKSAG